MSGPIDFVSRVKYLGRNNFSPAKTFQYEKEAIAGGVLLFSNYSHAAIVFLPTLIALAFYLNNPWIIHTSYTGLDQLQQFQINNLVSMLKVFKVVTLLLIGYFGVMKFQASKKSGSLGYWLAMGMDRLTFYNYVVVGFTLNGIASSVILLFHIFLIEHFYLPLMDLFVLIILMFSSLFLLTSLFFFVNEALDNSEIAFLTISLIYVISLYFTDLNNPLNVLFNAELYFTAANRFILFGTQVVLASVFQYLGWRFHREIDILLGG